LAAQSGPWSKVIAGLDADFISYSGNKSQVLIASSQSARAHLSDINIS